MMADYSLLGQYKGFGGALKAAKDEALKNQLMQVQLQKQLAGPEQPASVREYEYFNSLDPQSQKKYLQMKRAEKILDTGAGYNIYNPIAGTAEPVISQDSTPLTKTLSPEKQPQYLAELERRKKVQTELFDLEQNLPKLTSRATELTGTINKIISHPGLEAAVGPLSSRLPTTRGATADFENLVKQVQGNAFLEAYSQLKGGGAISEAEGLKAEQAISRMQLAASEEGFLQAAEEFKDIVNKGLQREKARYKRLAQESNFDANLGTEPTEDIDAILSGFNQPEKATSVTIPKMGEVRDGYVFLGGNPNDPKRWKKR